jgi:hypothetical protein
MQKALNLVSEIRHIKLSALTAFSTNGSGKAFVAWTSYRSIPFTAGTVSAVTEENKTPSGPEWSLNLTATTKNELKKFEPGIILLVLESGETLVFGNENLPVTIILTESLMKKGFKITHKSFTKPYKLAN